MTDFQSRIQKNNLYYERFAEKVAERTENRNFDRAVTLFTEGLDRTKTIVDLGCGSGIHLKRFQEMGFPVLGVEPSEAMRDLTSQLGIPVIDGTFETFSKVALPELSGIWCASSLLHVPHEAMPGCILSLSSRLGRGGKIFVTVRIGNGSKWDRWDDQAGDAERFIQLYSESELVNAHRDAGFEITESWVEESYWGRPSQWVSIVAAKV